MSNWQLIKIDDENLITCVTEAFSRLYRIYFIHELLINHHFPIEIRAFRHTDIWRVFLLLTPWTLARVFIPGKDPKIELPFGWTAAERVHAPITMIGPTVSLEILGGTERAHVCYHPVLGHYLMQPLIQSMETFATPEDAFLAWNEIISCPHAEYPCKKCEWEQDVSRRESFAPLRRRAPLHHQLIHEKNSLLMHR